MNNGTVRAAVAAACACATALLGRAEAPAVVWVSQPVNPGEAVMVYGGPWTNVSAIELSGPDRRRVAPLQVTDDCVTFVYPKEWPLAAFAARVTGGSGTAELRVNAPEVWWLQGDAGKSATPGGWLRAFGRSVGYCDKAFLELRGAGRPLKLLSGACDLYTLRVALPSDVPPGEYEAFLNNGLAAEAVPAGRIRIAPRTEPWPDTRFDVTAYGAVANDANDDTRAVQAALAALTANGGGVLYFPRGRFGLRGELALPPRTLLRGESMTLTQLYWLDDDNPKGALLSGTCDFGVEEVFLSACNIDDGIMVREPEATDTWKNENVLFRRVRVRFLHTDTTSGEETFRRSQARGSAFRIGGEFVRVLDCDFYVSKGESGIHGDYLEVSGNRFDGPGCGYLGGRQVIFEGNLHEGRGMSFANGSRNVYFKGNRIGGVYGDGDRESFTTDGGRTTYSGAAAAVSPCGLTLPPGAWRDSAARWIGETVLVIGGKGAGQLRLVSKIEGRAVTLDRPWDILPGEESYFVVGLERNRLLFIDNDDRDGNPFQLYGSATDVVFDNNRFQRNSGVNAFGMTKGGSPEPSWFIQFLGNQILEGNAVRGPMSYNVPALDGWIAFFDRGILKPLTYPENRVGIMRRNVLHGNAYLDSHGRTENVLIENNDVRHADRGVVVAQSVRGAIVRGNRFNDVTRPYAVSPEALLSSADRLVAGLSAAEAALKAALPAAWKNYRDAAEALAKQELPEAEAAKAAAAILSAAAQALSAAVGDRPVPAATIEALFGLSLSQESPWLFGKLAAGKAVKVAVGGMYPAWSLPASLSAEPGSFEGWQVRAESPVKLVPGGKGGVAFWVTRPDDRPCTFSLPVTYRLAGDGWAFSFVERYAQDTLTVSDFLVAGPFKNRSGQALDTDVHPPEIRLDATRSYDTLDGRRPWAVAGADANGAVDLCLTFTNAEMATAHAVAVVRAARPLQIKVDVGTTPHCLLFVNGERTGSSARRDAVGGRTVDLKPGDNLLHLISSHASGAWPLKLTLTAVDPTQPGDLRVVPAAELARLPLLSGAGAKTPEGRALPDSQDVDWKLVYDDDFNRSRIGAGWTCQSPGWMTQAVTLRDHAMVSEAGWGFLTCGLAVKPPIRIECDLLVGKRAMCGVYLCPEGLGWRNFWGKLSGRGYCLSLGWHDAKNNRVMRDTETVLLDEKATMLEAGKSYHVTAQFVPPLCQLFVDGKRVLEYRDERFLAGLDRIGVFTLGNDAFDNVRIYTGTK